MVYPGEVDTWYRYAYSHTPGCWHTWYGPLGNGLNGMQHHVPSDDPGAFIMFTDYFTMWSGLLLDL